MNKAEKKEKIIKIIVINILFVICLAASVWLASYVLEDKSSIKKNHDFFNQKEDFDVLFFGSSHSELFVNPMILWKDYGIVSYNFGNPEEGIPVTYWGIRNAIGIHKPKVIVFDVSMVNRGENYSDEEHLHYALDSYPTSREKINAANDLLTDKNEKLELFFKIGNYHSRWKDIKIVNDPFVKGSLSYGEYHTMKVQPFEQYPITNQVSEIDDDSRDLAYIMKIIELCKDNDIELVLAANPFQCSEARQADINRVEQIANQSNVPFLNFIKMDNVIDYDIDLYDCEHVNQSGLNKMCDYWGSYLVNKCGISDHRGDARYYRWIEDYEKFKQLKYESIWWMVDDIEVLLQSLHDNDIRSYVFIGRESNLQIEDEHLKRLVQNIGRDNITVESDRGIKSRDLWPLELLNSTYKVDDYGLLVSEGKVVDEEYGDDARKRMMSLYDEIEIGPSDVVVTIIDNETNELKMIRKYSGKTDEYENIYLNIPKVYFE